MPRYTVVNSQTFIGGTMRAVGEVVEYSGWPGASLDPVAGDAVASKAKAFYSEARKHGRKVPASPDLVKFAAEVETDAAAAKKAAKNAPKEASDA